MACPCPPIFISSSVYHPSLHSFPTRRSSDLYRIPRTLLFASGDAAASLGVARACLDAFFELAGVKTPASSKNASRRSEEHTPELQSRLHIVCRLPLGKQKTNCPLARTIRIAR